MSLSYLMLYLHHLVHPVLILYIHGQQPRQHLSASLKARLSKYRRSFTTPSSVAKRLCVDDDDDDDEPSEGLQVVADPTVIVTKTPGHCRNVAQRKIQVQSQTSDGVSEAEPAPPLPAGGLTLKDRLRRELKAKMDDLRRLNMVKVYRSKVDTVLQLSQAITIIVIGQILLSAKAT